MKSANILTFFGGGGEFRILNNDHVAAALQPTRKIITINNQQYVVSQGGQGNFATLFSKFSIILKFSKILGISINYHGGGGGLLS